MVMDTLKPLDDVAIVKIREQRQQSTLCKHAAPKIRYIFFNEKKLSEPLPTVDFSYFPPNVPYNWYYVCLFLETNLLSPIYQKS